MDGQEQENQDALNKQRKHILDIHLRYRESMSQEWDKYIAWYLGDDESGNHRYDESYAPATIGPSKADFRIDANYTYALVDTMMALVVSPNPQVTINPNRKDLRETAQARESLINDTFRRDKMRMKERKISLHTVLYGHAYSKTVWSMKHNRPVTSVLTPKMVFSDPTVPFEDARYVIEAVPYTEESFRKKVQESGWQLPDGRMPTFDRIPQWFLDPRDDRAMYDKSMFDAFKWIIVYEYWDLERGTVSFMLENVESPLWSGPTPYKYVSNPYSRLTFNESPRDELGVSDIKLISKHQEQLNELDALQLWHTFTTIPIAMVDVSAFDNPEDSIQSFANCTGPGDIARMELKGDRPINSAIMFSQTPASVPAFDTMRSRVVQMIEFILSLPQFARGAVGDAETATELGLADGATKSKNGMRKSLIGDWRLDVARKVLGIWREYFPEQSMIDLPGRGKFSEVLVDKMSLAFDTEVADEGLFNEEWYYSFDTAPSSPAENDRAALVSRLVQFLPFFMQSENVDKAALAEWMAHLISADRIIAEGQPAQQGAMAGMPGVPGFSGAPGAAAGQLQGEGMDKEHEGALKEGKGKQLASQPKIDIKGLNLNAAV